MSLPLVNACLNGTCAVLLVYGLAAIKRGRRETHERTMYCAFAVSVAFLACYLYYHLAVARGRPTKFNGTGATHALYLALLGSHTVLAIVNLPMVLRTLYLARRGRWEAHKRSAKWTFPVWMYVSVTGVAVYVVLYHLNPSVVTP
jgi:putative membrane protein